MNSLDSPKITQPAQVGSAVRSAMTWNLVSMLMTQLAQASIFVLMAHRLDPVIFGLFGLAAVFVDLFSNQGANSFVDALLQRQDFRRRTLSTAFWSALAIMTTVVLVLFGGAVWISTQLNQPDAAPVLAALSLTLLFGPLIVGPTAVAKQRLDFKGLAVRNVAASLAGALAGLAVTFTPYIAWALVVQRFVQAIVSTAIMMLHVKVFPHFEIDAAFARGYLRSSAGIFAAQGIASSVGRAVDLFIGYFFGLAILGCLRVASKLTDILMSALINPIGQLFTILIPPAANDPARRSEIVVQLSAVIAAVSLPGFVGVALTAGEITSLLLPKYPPVADMLMVLCGLGVPFPLCNFRNGLLTATHQLRLLIWLSVGDIVLVIAAMWLAKDYGWQWVLFAAGINNFTLYLLAPKRMFQAMGTTPGRFFRTLAPPYLATAIMTAGVLLVSTQIGGLDPASQLGIKAATGATLYLGVLWLGFRTWTLATIHTLRSGGAS